MTGLSVGQLDDVAVRMVAAGAPVAGALTATPIAGGRSNLTYELSDGTSRWVLRTPPRAGRTASAHDVAREHRVTSALMETDVPVPAAVLLCEDPGVLGVPFTVSGFVDGVGVRTQADLASFDDGTLAVAVESLLATLAALHRVDHHSIGLDTFGRPDGYAARQLRRWSGQWESVGPDDLGPLAATVLEELRRTLPEQRATSVVHGDYRIDNVLIGAAGTHQQGRVAAVVDWELSTIGDPVADVAMMCAYRHEAFDLVVGAPSAWTTSPRLPGSTDLAAAYERHGGESLAHWDFHLALACFKVAVISAGIDHRRLAGSGAGPGFDTAGQAVEPYLYLAHQALSSRQTRSPRPVSVAAPPAKRPGGPPHTTEEPCPPQ